MKFSCPGQIGYLVDLIGLAKHFTTVIGMILFEYDKKKISKGTDPHILNLTTTDT